MKLTKTPTIFVIFGPQASGKGTQAEKIASNLNMVSISAGNVLKKIKNSTSPLAQKIKTIYDQGKLIDDQLVFEILKEELKKTNINNGIIFDGFPRNIKQIDLFFKLIKETNYKQLSAIFLEVSKETVLKRIGLRKVCDKCGKPYLPQDNSYKTGSCDKCQGKIITRSDDEPAAISKRLDIYYNDTVPVINYFKDKNNLITLNGEPTIDIVYDELIKKLTQKGIVNE